MKAPTMATLVVEETPTRKAAEFEREALPQLDAVYRFALSLTGDPVNAEDLVQETLLKAYRSWHRYEVGTNVRAWLFTILRNIAISNHRRARPGNRSWDFSGSEDKLAAAERMDWESRRLDRIIAERVLAAIQSLLPDFREVVVLRDVEGFSYGEIAEIVGVPVGTVKSRLFRARRILQQRLFHLAAEVA